MSYFRSPDLHERQSNAATVKKAMLEKFRAASNHPAVETQRANRIAVNEARTGRMATRQAAKEVHEAELAAEAVRAAERAAQAQREAEQLAALASTEAAEKAAALAAEQKAERDARYAARKAAKKYGGEATDGFRRLRATELHYPRVTRRYFAQSLSSASSAVPIS